MGIGTIISRAREGSAYATIKDDEGQIFTFNDAELPKDAKPGENCAYRVTLSGDPFGSYLHLLGSD